MNLIPEIIEPNCCIQIKIKIKQMKSFFILKVLSKTDLKMKTKIPVFCYITKNQRKPLQTVKDFLPFMSPASPVFNTEESR